VESLVALSPRLADILPKAPKHSTTKVSSDDMDVNRRIELIHEVESMLWVERVNQTRTKLLPEWISTLHPDRLCCQIEGGFLHGAYNVGQKVTFSDGTAWLIRFPRVGNICGKYADEKVAMEVEVMTLIREKTTIPVPQIKAWGLAASNPLGLGPFIIMDFIEGVSLNTLLKDPNAELDTRLIKEDINNSDIEFRQFANFLLQLFKLDFDRIGSLPSPKTGFPVPISPI
jgi:aminoglycoside phosphotransferase (APT) family kinase protein